AHSARAIWALVGRLNLSTFYQAIESSPEEGGRPAFDPQLLISLWVYAYSLGIGSAREVARRCEYDPAFQWLTGSWPACCPPQTQSSLLLDDDCGRIARVEGSSQNSPSRGTRGRGLPVL